MKPGRTLRTATKGSGVSAAVPDVCRPAAGHARSRADGAGRRGRTCTGRVGTFYVPPPAGTVEVGEPLQQAQAAGGLRRREAGRRIPRKSRGVYAVITDFSL